MNDIFAAQGLIVTQLAEQVPQLRLVRGARDFASILERPGTPPAAYVLYDGQDGRIGAGQEQLVEQKWLVVAVVRNARDAIFGSGERLEAGPLLLHICQALLGWQPAPEYGALYLSNAPAPSFNGGFALFPLRFITRVIVKSE